MLVPAVTKYGTYIITIIILYCMDGTTYIDVVSKLRANTCVAMVYTYIAMVT